jgi:hypothetical protein
LLKHPDTTGNIDFYAQKRLLEKESGKVFTTKQARKKLKDMGRIVDYDKTT